MINLLLLAYQIQIKYSIDYNNLSVINPSHYIGVEQTQQIVILQTMIVLMLGCRLWWWLICLQQLLAKVRVQFGERSYYHNTQRGNCNEDESVTL